MTVRAPDLSVPTYAAGQFTWVGTSGHADASDLGISPGVVPGRQVWSDAADVGFLVKGRTAELLFTLAEEKREGEVVAWEFRSATEGAASYRITVTND